MIATASTPEKLGIATGRGNADLGVNYTLDYEGGDWTAELKRVLTARRCSAVQYGAVGCGALRLESLDECDHSVRAALPVRALGSA